MGVGMSEPDIGAYAHNLIEDVRAHAETVGCGLDEAFTQLMLEQFCADGHAEDAVPVYFRDRGVEVSGYGASSDDRCVDLFLTRYSPRADDGYRVDRGDVDVAFRRLRVFLERCLAGQITTRGPASDVAGMCSALVERFERAERIRFVFVTNARSVVRERFANLALGDKPVVRDAWDLRRLANWAASGSRAEPIIAEFPDGLPCLATPRGNEDYSVFLAIVPGRDLADLYSTHGARLLELNVRSFLQVRGGVNKGILDTLRTSPNRFLAYNNGIAATASQVDFEEAQPGQRVIRRIHNLQIVNGGQTTATIHHAQRNGIPIDRAQVQMKLTVVSSELLDEIVPRISAYSNTQNRVTASDLKANSIFHVDVERIMRTLWAPATSAHPHDTHWFYERARGQYANAIAREGTAARQKLFKTVNPPTQKFTKSDLAKFVHCWEMLPHVVSLGAEKNFVVFSDRLESNPIAVDKNFCRQLVAKAVLFRRTDKIVARQDFGGYKANIVAYTIAKLVQTARQRVDLERIWREQDLSPALRSALTELSAMVQKIITSPPSGRANIGEWTKRPECWDAVRDLDWMVPADLEAELVDVDTYPDDLRRIKETSSQDWLELAAWGEQNGVLDQNEQHVATELASALANGWDPAGKHVRAGVEVMCRARDRGFRRVAGF
jgi:AIPR protein/abortive infection phage resistance-like protein